MLRADFHIHTRFSLDAITRPQQLVDRCLKMGLDCIAVTDHNNLRGALEVQRIAPFKVIVGEEVKTRGGEMIGLFLKEEIPKGLSPIETARRIKDQGGLLSIPHPFDRVRRGVITAEALQEVLPYVDMMEAFNARNVFDGDNKMAQELIAKHGLLAVADSDSHTPWELGHTYVELPDFDGTPEGLKLALREARLVCRKASPLVHTVTTVVRVKRRLLRF